MCAVRFRVPFGRSAPGTIGPAPCPARGTVRLPSGERGHVSGDNPNRIAGPGVWRPWESWSDARPPRRWARGRHASHSIDIVFQSNSTHSVSCVSQVRFGRFSFHARASGRGCRDSRFSPSHLLLLLPRRSRRRRAPIGLPDPSTLLPRPKKSGEVSAIWVTPQQMGY